jgi:drug/metabolite transporter (DMT)-like permease
VLAYDFWSTRGALDPLGMTALIIAGAMWALYSLLFKRSSLSAIQAAGLICVWSALCYIPYYALSGLSRLGEASFHELLLQAGYQGIAMSVVATFAFNRAVSLLGSGAATVVIALVPVAATILAIPVLGEWPSPLTSGAVVAIAAGVAWAARPDRGSPS